MGTAKAKHKEISHPHIERKPGVCGGEPTIKGTRISVGLIAEMERMGKTVDDIVATYPHINHAQVYDALAYYYDNNTEIDKYIYENSEEYLRKKYEGEPWIK